MSRVPDVTHALRHRSDPRAVIEVRELHKSYRRVEAVRGINFDVRRGTTTALLGGNGAGKTTTLSMLLGVLTPTSGAIRLLGEDMPRHRYRVLPRMNFTSPYVDLPKRLTVSENLRVYARLYGVEHARERIDELATELDFGELLERPYGNLSAGQRTRVEPRQGAAEPSRGAAARRADRVARPRRRRPHAHAARATTSDEAGARCCSRRTTWARSSACATT